MSRTHVLSHLLLTTTSWPRYLRGGGGTIGSGSLISVVVTRLERLTDSAGTLLFSCRSYDETNECCLPFYVAVRVWARAGRGRAHKVYKQSSCVPLFFSSPSFSLLKYGGRSVCSFRGLFHAKKYFSNSSESPFADNFSCGCKDFSSQS